MGETKGFLRYGRQVHGKRPVQERIYDFNELELPLTAEAIHQQAARCIDCGIPFCHGVGCPLANNVPELNELIYNNQWRQACQLLHSTNNFPEITGRVCPAPCETACTLSINDEPVAIRDIELQIVERGFDNGWIKPLSALRKSGKKIAIIGSGPAGLACAQQLARAGHSVVVFEKDLKPGGLLRYGVPDFKLTKNIIDRRLRQLVAEGVQFQTEVNVGMDISARYLQKMFDCVCLATGAAQPRDLTVPGRGYDNIVFAMDFLKTQNKLKDKVVVVIGGGDTGSDCVGTARRQGAKQIYQLEILPKPPDSRPPDTPWPTWPRIMRTSSSHEEGCERIWSVLTKSFSGSATSVRQLNACRVEWVDDNGNWKIKELAGTEFALEADLVVLALGFTHLVHKPLVDDLGLKLDDKGNVFVNNYQTSRSWVFAAGDAVNGASLVVSAIDSGRKAAYAVDRWLKGL
jgi:glutamate synthase (NADPH/NADH) small chain